jgi:hypothetical protein
MTKINLYKGTLPHEAEGKVGGARILIKPASAGTGLIAGGVVRTILEVAGVSNVLSASHLALPTKPTLPTQPLLHCRAWFRPRTGYYQKCRSKGR